MNEETRRAIERMPKRDRVALLKMKKDEIGALSQLDSKIQECIIIAARNFPTGHPIRLGLVGCRRANDKHIQELGQRLSDLAEMCGGDE